MNISIHSAPRAPSVPATLIHRASAAVYPLCCLAAWIIPSLVAWAQFPRPDDAPPPLSIDEAREAFRLPPGYRIELVVSEPLIREPSGVCWDERGRLFVCELHGYNLEGQYDIEELNKTGRLDREVRRIQANERAKDAAKEETYGTVKLLKDVDGDGRMDQARVFADRLPPCYGIVAARGGLIVAAAPDIVYLADRDEDGVAEIHEVLFTGFAVGALERGINAPKWGPDDWIYFGSGHGGGRITGPHLPEPIKLPNTDFRIKSDGSALEPIPGGTHTIGFAFTPEGERFVTSTQTPAIQIAPLPWRYLARNPDAAVRGLEHNAASDNVVYPTSKPHPWRTKRAADPGFAKFYTDRYGIAESTPNGYFTSACSPLVYQDPLLPNLRGTLLCCEPAQNLIHRAVIIRDGLRFGLHRPAGEEESEFLTSTDPWFHPIALTHAPDGSIWIVDFYREIIEDYSAIPRYLQQQYGLANGQEYGRIWRLASAEARASTSADFKALSNAQLVEEVAGKTLWRRQTARRLLIERGAKESSTALAMLLLEAADPVVVLNALYTLDGLGVLDDVHVERLLAHPAPAVRVHAMRACERWLHGHAPLVEHVIELAHDSQVEVRLQAALTLGELEDDRAVAALAAIALEPSTDPWLHQAVLSSVAGRGDRLLAELLSTEESTVALMRIPMFLKSLVAAIAARRDPAELSRTLERVAGVADAEFQSVLLSGLLPEFENAGERLPLSNSARQALNSLATSNNEELRRTSVALKVALQFELDEERRARLASAVSVLDDLQAPVDSRLEAVSELAVDRDAESTQALVEAFANATPRIRAVILESLFAHRDRLPTVLSAMDSERVPAAALGTAQRRVLLEHENAHIRERARKLLELREGPSEETFRQFAAALQVPGDAMRGEKVFREQCAVCHRAHGIGAEVGPDLTSEFDRSPETILRDILAPSDSISAGYATYLIETVYGQTFAGVLKEESANSFTLRLADGKERIVLRKDVQRLEATSVSLMPENLVDSLKPQDVCDVIAWLSRPAE